MTRFPSRWRSLPPLLIALLVLGAVPAAAQTAVAPLGTADSTVDLGGIAADGAAGGTLRLGGLRVFASSDDDPARNAPGGGRRYAEVAVDLAGTLDVSANSDDGGTEAGASADIGELGVVTAGVLEASATDAEVRAQIASLSADLATARVRATVEAVTPVTSTVSGTAAESSNGVRVRDLRLTLGDVVAEAVLDAQASSVLDDIAAILGVSAGTSADVLADTELLALDELSLVATARADGTTSSADAVCTITGLRVAILDDVVVEDCDDLAALLVELDAALEELLDTLPLVGAEADLVTLTAPAITVTADGARDGGYLTGRTEIIGLGIRIDGFDLLGGAVVEDLVLEPAAVTAEASFRATDGGTGGGGGGGGGNGDGCDDDDATAAPACARPVERLAGDNRVDTAVEVSSATFTSADVVVLARSDVYADALAGAPVALRDDAPILLTPPDDLTDGVAAEIERLGASEAILLGGTAALSAAVEAEARAMGLTVTRIGGENRFGTAALLAAELGATTESAVLVEGGNPDPARGWPDAVSAAPFAAFTARPILLVTADDLPDETAAALETQGVTEAVVVGGEAAVGTQVVAEVEAGGTRTRRVAGMTRYETSAAVYAEGLGEGMNEGVVWLATGSNWPDALVVGPAAAAGGNGFLIIDGGSLSASPPTRDVLIDRADLIETARIVGGTGTVSAQVEQEVRVILNP